MVRRFRKKLFAAAFIACSFAGASNAHAAEVVLSSGSVLKDCSGQLLVASELTDLSGQDFFLHLAAGDGFPGRVCAPSPVSLVLATLGSPFDFINGSVIFQGVGTSVMTGRLTFDQTSITGFVEGRSINPDVVLFTVSFTGRGIGSITNTRSTFTVNAVPEPATVILLSTGVAIFSGARRWRKARTDGSRRVLIS